MTDATLHLPTATFILALITLVVLIVKEMTKK